jgi:geranylgeranyl pyrophosphate synthase
MAKGKPTLPLIDFLEQDNDDPNAILGVTNSREAMRTMLEDAGSIQRAWSAVDDLVSSAVQELVSIPASSGVAALQDIARRLTERVGSVGGQPS